MNPGKVFRFALAGLAVLLVATTCVATASAQQEGKPYKQEQLDQMLAPVALYPDSLLAQVLMASTYPLEVVEADRWVKKNGKLKGDALNSALDKMDWDPSVKALVPFPQVLATMSDQVEWTRKLGDAFIAQQADVMATVQKLRAKAQAQNTLKTTKEQQVIVEQNVIRIEPADPQVIYIPSYNPTVVYGAWPAPAYPPYYWGAPVVAAGVGFAAGVAVGAAWADWGHCNWGGGTVNVNVNNYHNFHPGPGPHPPGPPGPRPPGPPPHNLAPQTPGQSANWQHDPSHRKGVPYGDDASRQRYSQKTPGSPDARNDYRGHSQGTQPQGPNKAAGAAGRPGTTPPKPTAATTGTRPSQSVTAPKSPAGYSGQTSPRQPSGMQDYTRSNSTAFEGMGRGSEARMESDRGRMSRESGSHSFGGGGGHGGFRGRR